MAEITSLSTMTKANIGTNDYFVVANKSTKKARKVSAQSFFASITTVGTGSENLYTSVTNRNQINLKGIKSGDTGLLTVATTSDNLVLTVLEAGIDLSLCNNTTSAFLTSVNFASGALGTLGVSNGGTGLTTIPKGSILYTREANILSSQTLTTNGQLLIGDSLTGYPSVGSLTSTGSTINITNGNGTINLEVASTTTLSSTLDAGRFNLNLNTAAGTSFLSGDGSNEGVTIDTVGRVFVGDSTPTVPTLSAGLTVGGSSSNAIEIGNVNAYGSRTIKFADSATGIAGMAGKILGATPAGGNVNGGNVTVEAGQASDSGVGGNVIIHGGDADTSTGGGISFKTYTSKNTSAAAMAIGSTGAITNTGATTFSSTATFNGEATFNEAVKPVDGLYRSAPVLLPDASASDLTIAANCGRTNVIVDVSQASTYNIPTPTAAGQYYHFIYGGAAADASNVLIRTKTTNGSVFFKGAITHLDTNADNVAIFSDGNSNDLLTITTPQTIDVHCLSLSTTIWYIWGTACSVTAPAFSD